MVLAKNQFTFNEKWVFVINMIKNQQQNRETTDNSMWIV